MSARPILTADARQSPRKPVKWRARLLRADGSIVECLAVDSSVGGVGLIGEVPMRVTERVQVALQVPDEETGQLRVVVRDGRVVASVLTSSGYRIGVQLIDVVHDLIAEVW